eukprot:Sspe_Gene.29756::Locus_14318_Transcript_2_3_Confidence_0.400_Length_2945::g.29756::m.29756
MARYVVGVDVGSSSVRAAVVSSTRGIVAQATASIAVRSPEPDWAEQSTADIWKGVVGTVGEAVAKARLVHADLVVEGVGFDATCSLVVEKLGEWDVIMWKDHRAIVEAEAINSTRHRVLSYCGGRCSPEMQMPKLKWLKKHRPEVWAERGRYFDLSDWLAWKASGCDARSVCTVTCKWGYVNDDGEAGWDASFLAAIGLDDLGKEQLGSTVLGIGGKVGGVCDPSLADIVGKGIAVAAPLIDAHAGGLALFAGPRTLTVIAGTSACLMASSPSRLNVPGVWGPYKEVMVPGYWLQEGGIGALGALIDHVLDGQPPPDLPHDPLPLVTDLHIYPDFNGNRSPLADPTMKGVISGLTLQKDKSGVYYATLCALAYSVKHSIDVLVQHGHQFESIRVAGGVGGNQHFTKALADVTGIPVYVVPGADAMLLGGAVVAAVAAGIHRTVEEALHAMGITEAIAVQHPDQTARVVHLRRYAVYHEMLKDQLKYRALMAETT